MSSKRKNSTKTTKKRKPNPDEQEENPNKKKKLNTSKDYKVGDSDDGQQNLFEEIHVTPSSEQLSLSNNTPIPPLLSSSNKQVVQDYIESVETNSMYTDSIPEDQQEGNNDTQHLNNNGTDSVNESVYETNMEFEYGKSGNTNGEDNQDTTLSNSFPQEYEGLLVLFKYQSKMFDVVVDMQSNENTRDNIRKAVRDSTLAKPHLSHSILDLDADLFVKGFEGWCEYLHRATVEDYHVILMDSVDYRIYEEYSGQLNSKYPKTLDAFCRDKNLTNEYLVNRSDVNKLFYLLAMDNKIKKAEHFFPLVEKNWIEISENKVYTQWDDERKPHHGTPCYSTPSAYINNWTKYWGRYTNNYVHISDKYMKNEQKYNRYKKYL